MNKKVKITVIAKVDMRTIHKDNDLGNMDSMEPICPAFNIGDEFVLEAGLEPFL